MAECTIEYDKVEHETDDAILFIIEGDLVWMPKNMLIEHDEVEKNFITNENFAEMKELI